MNSIGLSFVSPNLSIRTYAIAILVGIVAATILTNERLKARGAESGVVLDIALWAVPFGIVGARIFHVVTHPDDYFGSAEKMLRILFIWEGGIAIFGSLIGGAIGVYIGCRLTGMRFWTFADALAPGLLLAQAFGRFGNWFNHELFGVPTSGWWGLEIEKSNPAFPAGLPAGTLFQPTFLFEIIWNVAGVFVILFLSKKFTLQWGKTLAVYLVWYGLGRSVFESIRIDPSLIFLGVRTNVWAAWAAILVGIVIFVVQSRRHPGFEPSAYLPGREWTPMPAVDSQDTYSEHDEADNDADLERTSSQSATLSTAKSGANTEESATSGTRKST
ncbi:MAG: prolipoprotein diacylglyceryl transferase [Actinomycetota bacterium]